MFTYFCYIKAMEGDFIVYNEKDKQYKFMYNQMDDTFSSSHDDIIQFLDNCGVEKEELQGCVHAHDDDTVIYFIEH